MGNDVRKPLEVVREIASRVAERLGLELDHVDVSTHRRQSFVRIYLDKEGGLTLADCQKASAEIGTVLDVEDPMPGPYTLEVSSPGLDRPLRDARDYQRHEGKTVRLHTYGPVDDRRDHVGELLGLEEGLIRLRDRETDEVRTIPMDQVAKARLEIEI